jgi:hypothetical protein
VSDELFTTHISQRVFQLHQLNEQIVFGVDLWSMHRGLEVEREPFLYARHACPLREIQEQCAVEHDGCSEDAVATQEIDLQLHRIPEPSRQVDVVPAFFVVAARRVVVDANDVAEIFVELGIELRLKDVVER